MCSFGVAACLWLSGTSAAAAPPSHGDTANALPGIYRVGVALPKQHFGYSLAATTGYGFTEAQYDQDGSHHRALGTLAASIAPLGFLDIGARFDVRYDKHPDQPSSDGWIVDPRFTLRLNSELADNWYLGGELVAWIPGSENVGTSFEATTVDARSLFGYHDDRLTVSGLAGFRLDNSKAAGTDADRLNPGDRIALGLSEFHAVLVGIGASYRISSTELLAEVTNDILLGSDAPAFAKSPRRVSLGARHFFTDRIAGELMTDIGFSSRPDIAAGDPLVPIEPRFAVFAGVRYRFDAAPKPTPEPLPVETQKQPEQKTQTPAAPTTSRLEVTVTDADKQPVPDAEVTFETAEGVRPLEADGKGGYRLDNVPVGPGTLRVRGEGLEPTERQIEVRPDAPAKLEVRPQPALPVGQVRGLVRSFGGKGLSAKIRVEPGGAETTTNNEGFFQVDVPPGEYEVTVEAPGYAAQQRKVKVEKNGVVVLNADLVKAR